MEGNALSLKFDTATFFFRDLKQMRSFLECFCFKDNRGRVFLHHGAQFHEFSELCKNHYKCLPPDLKFDKSKRTAFMPGRIDRNNFNLEI